MLLVVPAGASADPADRPGLAAITADMLDEGCGSIRRLDVHEALGRIGAQLDTDVGHDATVIGLTTLQRYLDRGLELVRDMILRPRFEQREVRSRARPAPASAAAARSDMPPAVADRAFTQQLYRGHPYGHIPLGTEGSLRGLVVRDIREFHRRAFSPERSTLIAVGDATHDALGRCGAASVRGLEDCRQRRAATRSHDVRAADSSPQPPRDRAPTWGGTIGAANRTRCARALDARLSRRARAQHDSRRPVRQPHQHEPEGRQGLHLRRPDRVRIPPRSGPFVLQASVQSDTTVDAAREALSEIRAIRAERPVTTEELGTGRAALTRGYPRNFETADQLARAAAQLALYDLPDDYFTTFVPKVLALTAPDITRVAADHIDPSRLVAVIVGDRDKITPSVASLDLGAASEVTVT